MSEQLPVAIYCRVSSARQDASRQLNELTEHAHKQGFHVVATFVETVSATRRQAKQRVELGKLLQLARSGQIRKVLVTEMSRIGRKLSETVATVEELMELKVSVWAKNLGIETILDNGRRNSAAMIVLMCFSEIAQNEAEELSERIKSGQANTDKAIGRPAGSTLDDEQLVAKYPKVKRELKAGTSIRKAAAICGVTVNTVQRVKKALVTLSQRPEK